MSKGIEVDVSGLDELESHLLRMHAGMGEMVHETTKDAADKVAHYARTGFPIGPSMNGHAITSIRAVEDVVMGGGDQFPYFGWLDFGGRVGKHGSVFRPFLHSGRFIWAALRDHKERIDHIFEEGLADLARSSGLDVD